MSKDYKKLYEDALENLKRIKEANRNNNELVDFIEYKYPELKESNDEKIRKAIQIYIDWLDTKGYAPKGEYTTRDMIAWLEKQGEQKHKDEPKFKVGDWVVRTGDYLFTNGSHYAQITKIDSHGLHWFDTGTWLFANSIRLWTIEDAKDGDVLAWDNSECIAIFKNIHDGELFCSYGYVGACTKVFETGISYHDIKGAHPATKEQRDLLFQKMEESCYELDSEKKELRKIEQKPQTVWKSVSEDEHL